MKKHHDLLRTPYVASRPRPPASIVPTAVRRAAGVAAVVLGILSAPSAMASAENATVCSYAAADGLNLYWMDRSITSCGVCDSIGTDRGWSCSPCNSGCNCLLQTFADPATGEQYDGYFYPGGPIRR